MWQFYALVARDLVADRRRQAEAHRVVRRQPGKRQRSTAAVIRRIVGTRDET